MQTNDWSTNNWFRHRINSIGSDSKLSKLVREYGSDGYAVYFCSLECIYSDGLGKFEVDTIADTLKISTDRVVEILTFAETSCGGLLVSDLCGNWTSRKANQLADADKEKREAKKQRQREYRARHNVEERSDTFRNDEERSPKNREEKRREEKKRKENNGGREINKEKSPLPPTSDTISSYISSIGKRFNVERFIDYYATRNWMVDGVSVSSEEQWKALARRWPEDWDKKQQTDTHPLNPNAYRDDEIKSDSDIPF